ncbi:MAG TPA: hypothetical protein VFB96_12225 [Pirellulaceae bacterium]|nr:hypothetical protein [Pirellulaceae bacterium]
MEGFLPIVAVVVILAIAIRLAAGLFDHSRIADYIQSRGGKVLSCHWWPFGPGWFGEKRDRIYEVTYLDAQGNQHRAACKTSLMSGVYFTEDTIVSGNQRRIDPPQVDRTIMELAEENRRLRAEVERLKRERA